jgi:hypothetical protein
MRPGWLRTRWPAVAVALVLVGYSTLLAYHITSRFEIVADVQGKQERYLDDDEDAGEKTSHGIYLNNLEQLGISTARLVSGTLVDQETTADYFSDPWLLATVGLALAGLGVALHQRCWWLVLGLTLAMLLPPAFSGKYRPILDGRYLMPLVPVLFVAIGLAVAAAARIVAATGQDVLSAGSGWREAAGQTVPRLARGAALLVLAGGTALLVAHPLTLLDAFYEESQEDGFSNALYLRTFHQIEAARANGETVLLDPQLVNVKSTGGGKASTSFTFLLALAGIPDAPLDTSSYADLTGRLAILHRSTADRLDDTMHLDPLDGKRANGKDSPSYRAYRIGSIEAGRR